jgi:phage terminase large subunit-like protein
MIHETESRSPAVCDVGEWEEVLQGIPGYDPFRGSAGCWFDQAAARQAVDFFGDYVRHVEGDLAGQPFRLEPWQQAIVANLFGWKRRDLQSRVVRRYRELFLYLPRKNGKSLLAAGIGLLVFFCDDEPGQQDFLAAADKEQAGVLFRMMKANIEAEPALAKRCRIYGGSAQAGQAKSIVKPDNSFLKVLSADAETKHGGNSHLVIVDELHAQPSRDLVDVLTTSSGSRKQPLFISITTADFDRPSLCNEKHKYACEVRDNPEQDPAFLPVVYEAGPEDAWDDPATWRKANPNIGVSVSEEYLARECQRAKSVPEYENTFRRLHLGQRTQQDVRAIPLQLWDKGCEPFELRELEGQPCWAGLDFGWRDDYAALVLVFPSDGDIVRVVPHFWIPTNGKRDLRSEPARDFIARKLLSVTDGNSTDMEAIYQTLRDVRELFALRKIAYDPANARKQGQDLLADGFDVCEFFQTKRNFSEPWKWMMAALPDGRLRHGGHAVLRWMAGNTAIEVDGLDGVQPKKKKSAEKIDGICALCMALGAWLVDPEKASDPNAGGFELW